MEKDITTHEPGIISRLKLDILNLGGIRSLHACEKHDLDLGRINDSFPQRHFPLGAVHEFICNGNESSAATTGFISGLLGKLMKKGGASIWISTSRNVFPQALQSFGVNPSKIIFIHLQKQKELLWASEEALKCSGLAGVICEIPDLGFTESRRFQLAVEASHTTGFVLRNNPRNMNANALVSRWRITQAHSESLDEMPGLGFPRWNIELLKIRNGKPGSWLIEWQGEKFHHIRENIQTLRAEPKRKTG